MAERQDEEEACTVVAELEAELGYLNGYVAELEAANEALRQQHAAAGQLQGARMQEDTGLQEGNAGRKMAEEDAGEAHALRQLCQERQALLEEIARDKAGMEQALADAQRQADDAAHNSSKDGQQLSLQAELQAAKGASDAQVRGSITVQLSSAEPDAARACMTPLRCTL